jgi:hypothetical protein
MSSHPWNVTVLAVGLLALAFAPLPVRAQGFGGPTVRDSKDGYIDSAIPGDQLRLRFDTGWDNRRANRAEFFYAKAAPLGPGLARPESKVDNQDLTGYVEAALSERLSGFVELPWRFLELEVNGPKNGLADMDAGFKYALLDGPDLVTTFQLRTFLPTGEARRGLSTAHVSLEPALLVYERLDDRLGWEGELRCWVPIGGTDFAGEVLRYGVGVHYNLFQARSLQCTPVVECIGWTALDGKVSIVDPLRQVFVRSAAGDTIVDLKVGFHMQKGEAWDIYTGYGVPLTTEKWYQGIYRVEFRLFF